MADEVTRQVVSYHFPNEEEWQDEYAPMRPMVGDLMRYRTGAYRVVEVWQVIVKREPFEHGVHAILEEVPIQDTLLGKSDPSFYGQTMNTDRS
jgi:hypothetical protein